MLTTRFSTYVLKLCMKLKNLNITNPNLFNRMLNEGKIINFQNACENKLSNSSMLKVNAKDAKKMYSES